jgi:glucose/mannose-6-phosphate isomerase
LSEDDPGEEDMWEGAQFALAADRLDAPDVIEAADPADMLRQVASAAAQVRTALRSCAETDLSAFTPDARPRAIVVAGMGSSGTAGDILGVVCGAGTPIQVLTVRTGQLPGWIGAADLVFAVSCSGTTPETVAVAREAVRRGCRLLAVGAQGSLLHRIAEQARAPFVRVDQAGTVLPRQTLWALTVPLLVVAERLGIARIGAEVYEQTATRLEEVSHQCRPASESFVNPGKSLALDLLGGLPVIWGTSPLTAVVATRFASQLNENAKCPAIAGILSEVTHNQLGVFDGPFAAQVPQFPLRLVLITDVELREQMTSPDIATTIGELANQRGIAVSELATEGEQPLLRLAAVMQLADYASVYLGIASGIDPGQAAVIRDLPARIE